MNVLFIDETEQYNKRYAGVGGVILSDDSIKSLRRLFKKKKETYGIPNEVEIKWSPDKGSWLRENLTGINRISAYLDILSLLEMSKAKLIVAVIQRDQSNQSMIEAKWKCIEFVTERYQFFLQEQDDKNGIIIADFPGSRKDEKELLIKYRELLETGTYFVNPKNIVMNLLTTESCLNPALQLADLIVGITTSMCTPYDEYAVPYWKTIIQALHHNRNGGIMGCGLKVFPKEIANELTTKLFPEEMKEKEATGEDYAAYIERQRFLYSALMSEEELNMFFPLP